jgi:hypothetical protein
MLSTMDVRAAWFGDRDRSWGSRSSPDSLALGALSRPAAVSGKASRMDGRVYPRLGLNVAVWEGGVRGGEPAVYVSRC